MYFLCFLLLVYVFLIWFGTVTLANEILEEKGYTHSFGLGMLLGIIYLIYAAGMPTKAMVYRESNAVDNGNNSNKTLHSCKEREHYVICEKCGYQIFDDEIKCSNCGNEKTSR